MHTTVQENCGCFFWRSGGSWIRKHQIWEGQIWFKPKLAQIRSDHSDLMFLAKNEPILALEHPRDLRDDRKMWQNASDAIISSTYNSQYNMSQNLSECRHGDQIWRKKTLITSIMALARVSNTLDLSNHDYETSRLLWAMVHMSLMVVPYRTIPYCCVKSLHVKRHTRFYSTKNGDKVILHQDNFRLHHSHCITSSIKNIIETTNVSGFLWQLFLITHWLNVLIAVHFS
jgi:hypothetical protein